MTDTIEPETDQATARDHYIKPAHARALHVQAAQWRAENPRIEPDGYVLVYEREVTGWTCDVRETRGWLAGCIAVPANETADFFIAVGGDRQNGAEKWMPLDIREKAARPAPVPPAARFDTTHLRADEPTDEKRDAVLNEHFAALRKNNEAGRKAVETAVPAMERLARVMCDRNHDASARRRDETRGLQRSHDAALKLTEAGMRVVVTITTGVTVNDTVRDLPVRRADGKWFVRLDSLGISDCRAVKPEVESGVAA